MSIHSGGCLCGRIRYAVSDNPAGVTTCHCQFCQKATGSAYMVEPYFSRHVFTVTNGSIATYDHRSEGSGQIVHVHFCAACGTKTHLSFQRFPDDIGIYAGTFDDPNWFHIYSDNSKHIFLGVAREETIIPPGIKCFQEHSTRNDGTPLHPEIFGVPHVVGPRPKGSSI